MPVARSDIVGYVDRTLRLRLVRGADEQQMSETTRIVRESMKDSVVRPAVSNQMQEENNVARVWQRAASVGR